MEPIEPALGRKVGEDEKVPEAPEPEGAPARPEEGSSEGRSYLTAVRLLALVAVAIFGLGITMLTYHYLVTTDYFTLNDPRVEELAEKHRGAGFSLQDFFKALTGFLAAVSTVRLRPNDGLLGRWLNRCLWLLLILIFAQSAFWSEGMDIVIRKTSAYTDEVYSNLRAYAYDRVREAIVLLGALSGGVLGRHRT